MSSPKDRRKGGSGGGRPPSKFQPPDKNQFEREISDITKEIKDKEARMKQLTWSPNNQDIATDLNKIGGELSEAEEKRGSNSREVMRIEEQLRRLGQEVIHTKDEASKLVAGLRHKSEEKIDDVVSKLEQQLQTKQFSPAEERRLQAEIDTLTKSKERLKEYLSTKNQVDKMRNEQDQLRKRRDSFYRNNRDLRDQESELKDKQTELKRRMDERRERHKEALAEKGALTKEIDGLYKRRKALNEKFRQQQSEYLELTREERAQREEEARKREEDRRAHREARRKKQAVEMELLRDLQYKEEKAVCRALILHLQKASGASILPSSLYLPTAIAQPHATSQLEQSGEYLRKKGEEEEVLFPTSVRRKSRRDKRRNAPVNKTSKRLHYNPTLFRQFSFLGISPPTNHSEVSSALEQLHEKLAFYESKSVSKNTDSEAGDSGVGSTGFGEAFDISEPELTSQEDTILDPLGLSPKRGSIENKLSPPLSTPLEESSNSASGTFDNHLTHSASGSSVIVNDSNGSEE